MVLKRWGQSGRKLLRSTSAAAVPPFHLLTTTLLSLLLPLSFLLLARLTTSSYLSYLVPGYPQPNPSSTLFSYTSPTLLHALVSLVSIAALVHSLTGQITPSTRSPETLHHRCRLYAAWIFLCTLQICVGLGIEGTTAAAIDDSGFGYERTMFSRVIFFLGLHETMLYWSRTVVKPVVDDAIFGCGSEEKWVERVAMAASFGTLWWWRLRDEVDTLVVMVEIKKELSMDIGVADFIGWWLYYVTVTIGMVRILKGVLWIGVILICRRRVVTETETEPETTEDSVENDEKV